MKSRSQCKSKPAKPWRSTMTIASSTPVIVPPARAKAWPVCTRILLDMECSRTVGHLDNYTWRGGGMPRRHSFDGVYLAAYICPALVVAAKLLLRNRCRNTAVSARFSVDREVLLDAC